ncbi:HTH-type transcriptional regulator ArgP [Paraburkholderia caballeronis]|uniref:HTH-type transcriptional regulator ArgP n=1 Tax=Paraburkholderia caballeronis TaxID=416943 RepID=UPI00106615C7|nr:HTH-type transcriptional regulator ArgP [Paraburkholderia caballeronis]TDV01390.1 LysR family transcriptional regulator [Paraburkholderia caballeronis]TDV05566.1 LysR family transcriptional regulator [Paraburkholderia caballeronis]TDV15337.1 LysR family transcriptional regulator [Paraburkholderia caballeronis]
MLDRDQLEAFAAVVEHQNFERAAAALSITRGAISQRIKLLEETLSAVLLIRDRPVLPTVTGEVLLRHVKAVRLLEQEVYREIAPTGKDHERARLSVAVNADSLATWFGACSAALLQALPVALEVLVEDQDHTWPMLLRGEVIGCVCTEPKPAQGFEAIRLGTMEYRCVATPAFVQTHFPHGLRTHEAALVPAVVFNRKDALHDEFLKLLFGVEIERYVKHYFPSPSALLNAIQMGSGYGVVPSDQAQSLLDSGRLVDLAPSTPLQVPLYWHHWQKEPSLAQRVTEFVTLSARKALAFASAHDTGSPVGRCAIIDP